MYEKNLTCFHFKSIFFKQRPTSSFVICPLISSFGSLYWLFSPLPSMKQVLLEVFKLIFPEKFCFPFQIHSLWFFCPDLQPIQSLFFPNASTGCFLVAFLFVIYFSYSTKLYKLNWTDTKLGGLIESLSFCLHNYHHIQYHKVSVRLEFKFLMHSLNSNMASICSTSSLTCPLCDWSPHMEYGKPSSVNAFSEVLENRRSN